MNICPSVSRLQMNTNKTLKVTKQRKKAKKNKKNESYVVGDFILVYLFIVVIISTILIKLHIVFNNCQLLYVVRPFLLDFVCHFKMYQGLLSRL